MVLDDIDWGAVAKAIGTRNHAQCMERWYKCQVRIIHGSCTCAHGCRFLLLQRALIAGTGQQVFLACRQAF